MPAIVSLPWLVRRVEMTRLVEVAFVVVPFTTVRLVSVLDAFESIPRERVESPETFRVDESVAAPKTESVPVAVMLAAVMLPEKRPLPWTPRVAWGEVEPIPTFPLK